MERTHCSSELSRGKAEKWVQTEEGVVVVGMGDIFWFWENAMIWILICLFLVERRKEMNLTKRSSFYTFHEIEIVQ